MVKNKQETKEQPTLLTKIDKLFPTYANEVMKLNVPDLDVRIANLQKGIEDAEQFRDQQSGEEIKQLRARLKELNADFTEVKKENGLKTKFLISLVREKGGA
jgi:hypothetical protein